MSIQKNRHPIRDIYLLKKRRPRLIIEKILVLAKLIQGTVN